MIFFIRHNGGSAWLDPPLGRPWITHGCFEKETSKRSNLAEKSYLGSRKDVGLTLGVVKEAWGSPYFEYTLVRIEAGRSVFLKLKGNDAGLLVGKRIFYSRDGLTVTDFEKEHYAFRVEQVVWVSPATQEANSHEFECPVCNAIVSTETFVRHFATEHDLEAL